MIYINPVGYEIQVKHNIVFFTPEHFILTFTNGLGEKALSMNSQNLYKVNSKTFEIYICVLVLLTWQKYF